MSTVTSDQQPIAKITDYNDPNRLTVSIFQNAGKSRQFFNVAITKFYRDKDTGEYKKAGGFSVSKQDALSLASSLTKAYQSIVELEQNDTSDKFNSQT